MAKFVVQKAGPLGDETVEADHYRINDAGALVLTVVRPMDGTRSGPGQRTYDQLVHAFAAGRWVEVLRAD